MPSDNFRETNLNDLVYTILAPIISDFMDVRKRGGIRLLREGVLAVDEEAGGTEELFVMDIIALMREKSVLVVA